MGAADTKTNEYMSDNNRFADVFNFFLYDGDHEMDCTAGNGCIKDQR